MINDEAARARGSECKHNLHSNFCMSASQCAVRSERRQKKGRNGKTLHHILKRNRQTYRHSHTETPTADKKKADEERMNRNENEKNELYYTTIFIVTEKSIFIY